MGAIIPPSAREQGSFADAAAVVHGLLTKGSGTEHARVRAVAAYLQQIGEHYYAEGKKEGAPEELVRVAAELAATKKARDEDGDLFAIERGHFRGENERLQEMVAGLTAACKSAQGEEGAWKMRALEEAKMHQRTTMERDALRIELRALRAPVPIKPPGAIIPPTELLPPPGDTNRCGACGWPLVADGKGCMRGDCSQRPLPTSFYDLPRYKAEVMAIADGERMMITPEETTQEGTGS